MALALHPTQDRVILHGVTWATFERLLADRGDHASVRIANLVNACWTHMRS